jgi:hypothetical protein
MLAGEDRLDHVLGQYSCFVSLGPGLLARTVLEGHDQQIHRHTQAFNVSTSCLVVRSGLSRSLRCKNPGHEHDTVVASGL